MLSHNFQPPGGCNDHPPKIRSLPPYFPILFLSFFPSKYSSNNSIICFINSFFVSFKISLYPFAANRRIFTRLLDQQSNPTEHLTFKWYSLSHFIGYFASLFTSLSHISKEFQDTCWINSHAAFILISCLSVKSAFTTKSRHPGRHIVKQFSLHLIPNVLCKCPPTGHPCHFSNLNQTVWSVFIL